MIVIGIVLALVLIGAYIFLGVKVSESIVNSDVTIFFWALYFVTLLTLVNISMSIFFYANIVNKKGPLGPRGIKGKLGASGDQGACENSCKIKTVQLIVEEAIQKYKGEDDITPMERKKICNIINETSNKLKINNWTLPDLQEFKQKLEDRTNYDNIEDINFLKNNLIDNRIVRQNKGIDNLTWVNNLLVFASSSIGNNQLSDLDTGTECD